jgi:exonuclease III
MPSKTNTDSPQTQTKHKISFILICNSLNNKLYEFSIFLNKYKPDVVSLNETKMNGKRAKQKLNFDGYKCFHRHRAEGTNGAGGVAVLVKSNICAEINDELSDLNLELVSVDIKLKDASKLTFISYYNPPCSIFV